MIHVTCRLAAKNRDQLRNPTLSNRVWAAFFIEIDDSCIDCIQQLAPRIMLQYIA